MKTIVGAVIGGALGAALGATVTEISTRVAHEAAQTGRPVTYQSNDGWQRLKPLLLRTMPEPSVIK